MKKLLIFIITFLILPILGVSQSRLVLNGAYVNITQGAYLVIDNPAATAITRNSGHIISEGESNTVKWNLGTTTGNYIVPFGYNTTDYIPVSFTKAAGTGSGNFQFSTYRTGWQNSNQLPSGVLNVDRNGADNSAYVIDRFWKIDLQNYSEKPTLTDLTLTYVNAEHAATDNTIEETNLIAQRWNDIEEAWDDYIPLGAVNTTSNNFKISSISSAEMYSWWTLVDSSSPLPIKLLTFDAKVIGNEVQVDWTTVSEIDNDFFSLERSENGIQFNAIVTLDGAGNSTKVLHYNYVDATPLKGISYYRLKQTDYDGKFEYSEMKAVSFTKTVSWNVSVYPIPVREQTIYIKINSDIDEPMELTLFDLSGNLIFRKIVESVTEIIEISLLNHLTPGIYILKILGSHSQWQQKLAAI
jgi:hypothetical protein